MGAVTSYSALEPTTSPPTAGRPHPILEYKLERKRRLGPKFISMGYALEAYAGAGLRIHSVGCVYLGLGPLQKPTIFPGSPLTP